MQDVKTILAKKFGGSGALIINGNNKLRKGELKMSRRRKILIDLVDLCTIVRLECRKLCFLSIYLGNARLNFLFRNESTMPPRPLF